MSALTLRCGVDGKCYVGNARLENLVPENRQLESWFSGPNNEAPTTSVPAPVCGLLLALHGLHLDIPSPP